MVPITITRHKKTKIDASANLLLYGYGSYGSSMSPGFSSARLSLINRDIIWVRDTCSKMSYSVHMIMNKVFKKEIKKGR